jgi:hypothetical protein
MVTLTSLKIDYIGGGSREWARKLMIDRALCPDLSGEAALYDIDFSPANRNEELGNWIQNQRDAVGDRRLLEFLPGFIFSLKNAFKWAVMFTPVSFAIQHSANQERIIEAESSEYTEPGFQGFCIDPGCDPTLHAAWALFKKLLPLNHEYQYLPAMAVT